MTKGSPDKTTSLPVKKPRKQKLVQKGHKVDSSPEIGLHDVVVKLEGYPDLMNDLLKAEQLEVQLQQDPQVAAPLIQTYERIGEKLHPGTDSYPYAWLQTKLGDAYLRLPTGDYGANLSKTIACYQEALGFWSSETNPSDYAHTQHNLGFAYWGLPTGDRATNLGKAIACYQQALRIWTLESAPLDYALAQNNLGKVYLALPTGDRAINLTRAISCFLEALRFGTPKTSLSAYARTLNNLSLAYRELPTGDRAANFGNAVRYRHEAVHLLRRQLIPQDIWYSIERLEAQGDGDPRIRLLLIKWYEWITEQIEPGKNPDVYAAVQADLGDAYRKSSEEDYETNMAKAIACYQEALRFWTPEAAPFDYAYIQHKLGNAYRELPTGDRATNLAQAITCYQEALRFWTPETQPTAYAGVQNNLGIAYSELVTGNRAENMEKAISHYQQALRFWTPEAAPLEYARVQANLGETYRRLPAGNRLTNLSRAVTCYQEALRFWTPDTAPSAFAAVQYNLGNAYLDLPSGDRNNIAEAITCYQEALRFWTPGTPVDYEVIQGKLIAASRRFQKAGGLTVPPGLEEDILLAQQLEGQIEQDPQVAVSLIQVYERILGQLQIDQNPRFYASIQMRLGTAYCRLPTKDRDANITKGIACYQEALRFLSPETDPLGYATLQHNLGNASREMLTGDITAHLQRAIACYEEALRFRTPESAPIAYARTQNNLGMAYNALKTGDRNAHLEKAIHSFKEALRFITPEVDSIGYGMILANLGDAYRARMGDRAENMVQAIACYEESLRFLDPKITPLHHGGTLLDLGNAYSGLRTGDRTENGAKAIACYEKALEFLTPENSPIAYARILIGLGGIYRRELTADNVSKAISYYKQALRILTPSIAPSDYAAAQHGLGNAYRDLLVGDRPANQAQAIACYEEALRFITPENDPITYAWIQEDLGLAYTELLMGEHKANQAQAIACYEKALPFLTQEVSPEGYVHAQINLGLAYSQLSEEDNAENIAKAIACYQEALRIWTPEFGNYYYALTQLNMGNAYRRIMSENRAENKAKALSCYQEALRFWTPENEPYYSRILNRTLGNLYFAEEEWRPALEAFRIALQAGERLYRAGLLTESKTTEVADNAMLYRNAAFAAVRCGEITEALLILERGKTRVLGEVLRLGTARPSNVPDEVWTAFEAAVTLFREAQFRETNLLRAGQDAAQIFEDLEQTIRSANAALDEATQRVRTYAPNFLHEIGLPAIQSLVPDEHTALVTFCITNKGSLGFVVNNDRDQGFGVRVVEVPTFTRTELLDLIIEWDADGNAIGGWLGTYVRHWGEQTPATFTAWKEIIEHTLAVLSQQLLVPILSTVPSQVERILFLPSAELFLFPLHAASLSNSGAERVCDRYQVSYAPSIEVLTDISSRARREVTPRLYAVINPEDDPRLIFTPTEGAAIAQLFEKPTIDSGLQGTKRRVIAGMQGRTYVHFSCHGSYNWSDPLASGLALADDRLTLADLRQGEVDLSSTRLVTLSACETGIVDIMKGAPEEYVGLPAGFLLAGVPCVVSSLWAVPDLSTALLMERFYRNHLHGGMDFTAALREAQAWVRALSIEEVVQYAERCYQQAGQKEPMEFFALLRYYRSQAKQNPNGHPFAHPYYWAAFTCTGV